MNLSEPGLDREEADRALERLGAESDRIAEALVAMDSHPGHQLLRAATPTGLTRTRWEQTSTAMATLWEQFALYRSLLERAREIRARRSRLGQDDLDELAELLTGQVVELGAQQVPIERRGLTGPSVIVERISLPELVSRMKAAYTTATSTLAEVDAVTSALLRRIDPLETELRAVTATAERLGRLAEPTRLRERLAEIRERAVSDPLGIDQTGQSELFAGIEADLAAVRAELARVTTARDGFDERIGRLTEALQEIERTQARTQAAEAEVHAKIARPGLAPAADLTAALRAGLDRAHALGRDAAWDELATEFEALEAQAAGAAVEADRALRARTGLLDRRLELRGRLDAYRAKAARLGRAEDLDLAALHGAAHDLLYTRPTDLAAATVAVNRYQQAVTEGAR
ncbi:hypothetical protein [Actinophytocola sp.]|uniref:hypothetical protein n=1 Tax=Actinophytocola sp. TaxID=1872138 RepID=UPI002D7F4AB0|nr:hypothetical protein [Actinophytocola sp.]HET9138753.1 hypothetical protein [Actinophytocola sp.]